jgi:3-oxoadipate enol-lactonase
MPFTCSDHGTRIHYEVAGRDDGEPLLLIQSLGADRRGWALQRFALGRHYRLYLVDNRGAGGSDKPRGPYDLEEMAEEALAVLDAEGIRSAHVLGASMGGVLAQILAVRHPDRVRSLVLACTASRHHDWRRELLEGWAEVAERRGMRTLADRAVRWLVAPRSHRRFHLPFRVLSPFVLNVPAHAFAAQARAILAFPDDIRELLREVRVPTMVIVGSQDILTPLADSEELCELIPHAELHVVGGAAHGLMFEHAGTFNERVLGFLDRAVAATAVVPEALSA